MTPLTTRTLVILAVALLVPAVASVWLMAVPQTMTASTYAIGATLLIALAAWALVSHENRRASSSLGHTAARDGPRAGG
jgi:hypothetical protein